MKTPKEQLWHAVIDRALQDATSCLRPGRRFAQHGSNTGNSDVHHARSWFRRPSRDFTMVCDFAGLDPDVVRRRALKLIAEVEAMEACQDEAQPARQGVR